MWQQQMSTVLLNFIGTHTCGGRQQFLHHVGKLIELNLATSICIVPEKLAIVWTVGPRALANMGQKVDFSEQQCAACKNWTRTHRTCGQDVGISRASKINGIFNSCLQTVEIDSHLQLGAENFSNQYSESATHESSTKTNATCTLAILSKVTTWLHAPWRPQLPKKRTLWVLSRPAAARTYQKPPWQHAQYRW